MKKQPHDDRIVKLHDCLYVVNGHVTVVKNTRGNWYVLTEAGSLAGSQNLTLKQALAWAALVMSEHEMVDFMITATLEELEEKANCYPVSYHRFRMFERIEALRAERDSE